MCVVTAWFCFLVLRKGTLQKDNVLEDVRRKSPCENL